MRLDNPESGLELLVMIPSLKTAKGRLQHETAAVASARFTDLDVPVRIVTKEDAPHFPGLDYVVDDGKLFDKFGFHQRKTLFGDTVWLDLSGLVLAREDRIVAESRRIALKSLDTLRAKALDFQVKTIKQKWKGQMGK